MPATLTRVLTNEQREQFHRDGFVILPQFFTPAEVDEIRDAFMAMAANGPVEGLSDSHAKFSPDDPLARYPRMMHPHRHPELPVGPLAMRYLLDSRVGAVLEELFADEPLGVQTMFYFKPPGARGQDLHQDNFYLRVQPGTCMAAWLAVDDADPENGGMVVVPQTRTLDIVCPQKADSTLFFTSEHVPVPEGLEEMPVVLKAGDMLFFNGSVIHGSYPNTSKDRFRRAFISHYVPKSSEGVSQWYNPIYRFNGEENPLPYATGGGPCGVVQDPDGAALQP